MSHVLLVLLVLGSVACQGELAVPSDAGTTTAPDVADVGDPDMSDGGDAAPADMEVDVGRTDPECIGVTCSANAVCGKGTCYCAPGFMGDPDTGCTAGNPCEGVVCPFGATCDDQGECTCDAGFSEDATGGCEVDLPTAPMERTEAEVCDRWNADYPERAGIRWQVAPSDECDAGILDPDYQLDAIRRVTLYRWLVGLQAVTTNGFYMRVTQACATALDAEDVGATHEIAESFRCYSEDASDGATESNIFRGASSPAESVDIYVEEVDEPNLPHRRWILNPPMGATAFGFRGSYSCMHALDPSGSSSPEYVAYPIGVFPDDALKGAWSFSSNRIFFDDTATVSISDSSGADLSVENVYVAEGNFGLPTLVWEVPDTSAPETYTVTLSNLMSEETELTYTVQLVSCP